MANRRILALVIMIIFGFGTIVLIPVIILSIEVSPNIIIEDSLDPIIYNPSDPSDIHGLNLNVDVGNIEIDYTYTPINYHAKIDIIINMIGREITGKTYTDYFIIEKESSNSSFILTMELKPDTDWFNTSKWIKKDVEIYVILNADSLFNVDISINETGNVNLFVPWGVNIKNIAVDINMGTALLDFSYCSIEGNITGFADNGDITLKTNNVYYTQNSIWDLTNIGGEILLNIYQSKEMGSNITGVAETSSGVITLIYIDTLPKINATVTLINENDNDNHVVKGFIQDYLKHPNGSSYGFLYTSNEIPPKNSFDLTLYKPIMIGDYFINLNNQ